MFYLFIISLIQEIIFWAWKPEIFDWTPDNLKNHKDKKIAYSKSPFQWKLYRFILEFVGIFVGWNLVIFFVQKFFQLQFKHSDIGNLWNLLLILILGLIGIFGRIPVIVDSVQDWFKR